MVHALELHRCSMPLNCDAVEFCDDHARFLVATYELDESSNSSREGSLSLFRTSQESFEKLSSIEAPAGVLDIKFFPTERDRFIAPLANGSVNVGRVTAEDEIQLLSSSESIASDITLSVSSRGDDRVAAAYSSGSVREFRITESVVKLLSCGKVHQHEAWAVLAMDDRTLSGGDDCTLRCSEGNGNRVMRRFDAGVTAIERDLEENGILVGTYEDKIYKFDLRNIKQPLLEKNLGGGIWRIKKNPSSPRFLALAGMYAGAFIVERDTLEVCSTFKGHESMCYGVAWRDNQRIVSCSFYDKLVVMWDTGIK
ncbi:diphthine methyltransferase homolog [Galendromus occidentalis]|uniref:methylated diphthine methylhydrolase n=1 Tax=Galendromus occidentalis TaxID=34638 RepID=A0AAJ6QQA4_9ACAR|nr:diphthine methyltransferase homolog [Galendromus occidentalis]